MEKTTKNKTMKKKNQNPKIDKKDRRPCPFCGCTRSKIHQWNEVKTGEKKGQKEVILKCYDCGKDFSNSGKVVKFMDSAMLSYRIPKTRPINDTRIIFISDPHCGHIGGYVPKSYRQDIYPRQEEYSGWIDENINAFKPYDLCICGGDMVDGKGKKSGGTELLSSDMSVQSDMAVELLRLVNAPKVYMAMGTDYHVGSEEQWESIIAQKIGAICCEEEVMVDVAGKIIDVKHHTGKSSTPYTTQNATLKHGIWQTLKGYKIDILARGHIHEFSLTLKNGQFVITLPGMQYDSRYGKKICNGYIDYGFLIVDIKANGTISFQEILKPMPRVEILKFDK